MVGKLKKEGGKLEQPSRMERIFFEAAAELFRDSSDRQKLETTRRTLIQ